MHHMTSYGQLHCLKADCLLSKCRSYPSPSLVHIGWTMISPSSSTHHSEEDAKLWVHIHIVSIGEDKVFPTFLLAGENDRNLLGRHRQNREVDAVEFIETAPRTGLSQTWKQTQICKKHYNYQERSKVPLLVCVVLISHVKQLCFSFFCCFVCNYNRTF